MHCAAENWPNSRIVNLEQKLRSTNFVVQARPGEGPVHCNDFSEIISLTEIQTVGLRSGEMSNTLSNRQTAK